jgi:nicotinamide-nucleotide amidase
MKVHIITVGDEILIGQIIDSNSAWIGKQLNAIGAAVERILSVGDRHEEIVGAISSALSRADVVLMTGGLGPTKDDITKKAIADFFEVEMAFSEPAYVHIQQFFAQLNRLPSEAHRLQCFMPENALLLPNKMGTAPGMWFAAEGGRRILISMPGVPYEMQYLMTHEVLPRLKEHFPGRPMGHRTLRTAGEGESRVAERLENFESQLPEGMKLAYLPNLGQVRLRLSYSGESQEAVDALLDAKATELRELLPDIFYGNGELELEQVVGQLLQARGLIMGTAESCTGGYIAHRITAVPGSSVYFEGAVVAYSNTIKKSLLGVDADILETYGAVSEETVRAMVKGLLNSMPIDIAVAISGIAGPSGGTPEKPVGTIWVAVGNSTHTHARMVKAGKDRLKNIEFAGVMALEMTRRFLLKNYPEKS